MNRHRWRALASLLLLGVSTIDAAKPEKVTLACDGHSYRACDSPIFCYGPILDKVQRSSLFKDTKQFVDMPTRKSVASVVDCFDKLTAHSTKEPTDAELQRFIVDNFHRVGYDLRIVIPQDWHASPAFLKEIADPELVRFGKLIHEKWKSLTRAFSRDKICETCSTTSLVLQHPFVIPGGRFREFYYWDSFWILEGLYVSEMCGTATGMMENMIAIIEAFGFIPNGSRIYYLNRSQPPMFTAMLERYRAECSPSADFVRRALHAADREYAFWMKRRSVQVTVNGATHLVNLYSSGLKGPRPESYREDVENASKLPTADRLLFHYNISTSAESGWDFSSRWLAYDAELTSIEVSHIAPIDLNSFLHKAETLLSRMHAESGNQAASREYAAAAQRRLATLEALFWSPEHGRWSDFHLVKLTSMANTKPFFVSDLSPLFEGAYRPEHLIEHFSAKNKKIKHVTQAIDELLAPYSKVLTSFPGGVPVSETISGQQWDFPNVWAPLQYMLVDFYGRMQAQSVDAELATAFHQRQLQLASKWIQAVYCSVHLYGHVLEKYHAQLVGQPGGGGEYVVQEGFGWSNGLTLWLLKRFGRVLAKASDCPRYPGDRVRPIEPVPFFQMP